MESIATFLLAALALAGSPGPNTLSLAAVGAAFGRLHGLGYMVGINLGMVLVIVLVGTGIAGLLLTVPGAEPVITIIAVCYFIYLAYRIATAPPLDAEGESGTAPKWIDGMILSLLNPKAYAAMAAMFSGFVLVAGRPFVDGLTKAFALLMVIATVNALWLIAGTILTGYLRDPRLSRIINVTFAVLLILSVAVAALL